MRAHCKMLSRPASTQVDACQCWRHWPTHPLCIVPASACAVCSNTSLPPLPSNAASWSSSCNGIGVNATCTAQCALGFAGHPTATCGVNGTFLPTVNGSCTAVGTYVIKTAYRKMAALHASLRLRSIAGYRLLATTLDMCSVYHLTRLASCRCQCQNTCTCCCCCVLQCVQTAACRLFLATALDGAPAVMVLVWVLCVQQTVLQASLAAQQLPVESTGPSCLQSTAPAHGHLPLVRI